MTPELLATLYKTYPLYQELFDKQLEFALAPGQYRAALCSRRAGKTTLCAVTAFQYLVSNPGSLGLYLGLVDKTVEKIFYTKTIRNIIRKYNLKLDVTLDEIRFSNGSVLLLGGANHITKIENYRGLSLGFCIIDEAASFRESVLGYLVDEIIEPALVDSGGSLILIGTPANHCSGFFHDITNTNKEVGWIVKKWTALDNPHNASKFAAKKAEVLLRKKADESLPKFRREYLGEWCTDNDALLISSFQVVPQTEPYDEDWRSVIGIDFGFNDQTAFSVIGWKRNDPKAYILETMGMSGQSVSQIANILVTLKTKYKPIRIVGDPAGCSNIIMKEFLDKYHVYMEAAKKQNKAHYIEILNDALLNANLVLIDGKTSELQTEMRTVIWNEDRTRELEGKKCDHLDATLYAYRDAIAYIEKIPVVVERTEAVIIKEMIDKQMEYDKKRFSIKKYGDGFSADIGRFIGRR